MGQIADNLAVLHDRLRRACDRSGRDPAAVRLMAVSKTHPPELVREAYDAGCRLFGENKVQELTEKAEALADLEGVSWAFVGHLQTNKAREVTAVAAELHALDSEKLARTLDRRLADLNRTLDVYVQVNSSGEESKFGLSPDEVTAFAQQLTLYPRLRVRGLMTLAANSSDEQEVRACFRRMQELQAQLRGLASAAGSYDEMSMGMSGDLELAVEHGATTVRVGQALFGARRAAA